MNRFNVFQITIDILWDQLNFFDDSYLKKLFVKKDFSQSQLVKIDEISTSLANI